MRIGTRPYTPCCPNFCCPQKSVSPSGVIGSLVHATTLESCDIWRRVGIVVLMSGRRKSLLPLPCLRSRGSVFPRLMSLRISTHGRMLLSQATQAVYSLPIAPHIYPALRGFGLKLGDSGICCWSSGSVFRSAVISFLIIGHR